MGRRPTSADENQSDARPARRESLVVDGMNVIGSVPDGWWRDRRGARIGLARRLASYARQAGATVTVVFDGRPADTEVQEAADLASSLAPGRGSLVVRYAPGGPNAADRDIAALVASTTDPSELVVVTSDAALVREVREAGAGVEGSASFRRRLDSL